MTYRHIGFSDSIVMRELEKIARDKGLIEEELYIPQLKKKASNRLVETGDVFVDAITLAAELRERGFNKQAAALENKAIIYKSAYNNNTPASTMEERQERESVLYNTKFGQGILNNAHLPLELPKLPSSINEGHFETIEEINKILVESTKHQPIGKLGNVIRYLNKIALDTAVCSAQDLINEINAHINVIEKQNSQFKADDIVHNLKLLTDIAPTGYDIKQIMEQANLSLNTTTVILPKNRVIMESFSKSSTYLDAFNKMGKLGLTGLTIQGAINYNQQMNILKTFTEADYNFDKVQQIYNDAENCILSQPTIPNFNNSLNDKIKVIVQENGEKIKPVLTDYATQIVVADDNSIAGINRNIAAIKNINNSKVINYINSDKLSLFQIYSPLKLANYNPDCLSIKKNFMIQLNKIKGNAADLKLTIGNTLTDDIAILNFMSSNLSLAEKLKEFDRLNKNIEEYMTEFSKAKYVNNENDETKSFDEAIRKVAGNYATDSAKATPAANSSSTNGGGSGGRSSGGGAPKKQRSDDAKAEVRRMQALCSAFGQVVAKKIGTLEKNTKEQNRIRTAYSRIDLTSREGAPGAESDGTWGPNTEIALKQINALLNDSAFRQVGGKVSTNKSTSAETDAALIERASQNFAVMSKALANLDSDIAAISGIDNAYMIIDILPSTITNDLSELQEGIRLSFSNILSLRNLKAYLVRSGFRPASTDEDPKTKEAPSIRNKGAIVHAANLASNRTPDNKVSEYKIINLINNILKTSDATGDVNAWTFGQFEALLAWLYKRAENQKRKISNLLTTEGTADAKKNNKLLDIKTNYSVTIKILQWHLGRLAKAAKANRSVTVQNAWLNGELGEEPANIAPGGGLGRNRGGGGGGRGRGGGVYPNGEYGEQELSPAMQRFKMTPFPDQNKLYVHALLEAFDIEGQVLKNGPRTIDWSSLDMLESAMNALPPGTTPSYYHYLLKMLVEIRNEYARFSEEVEIPDNVKNQQDRRYIAIAHKVETLKNQTEAPKAAPKANSPTTANNVYRKGYAVIKKGWCNHMKVIRHNEPKI